VVPGRRLLFLGKTPHERKSQERPVRPCPVSYGKHNDRHRIVVILKDSESSVWKDAQALLDWALKT
jgi:hypothetical protein